MTNEEVIELLKNILPKKVSYANLIGALNCYGDKFVYESPEPCAIEYAINSIQENTKLKVEIEQLKSELEQSVKLPCTCDNCKYADFMGVGAERFYCMNHAHYMNVGGYCSFGEKEEVEQSLKGTL